MQLLALLSPGRRAVTLLIAATFCLAAVPAAATPSTPAIESAQRQAAEAQSDLDELQAQLELRAEEYESVNAQLQETRTHIQSSRLRLERADRELTEASEQLSRRASNIYRSGNVSPLEVFMGTSSFRDLITRLDWMRRIGLSDAQLVGRVKSARETVRRAQESLKRREAEQIVLRDQAQIKKGEVGAALEEQAAYVSGLESQVAALIKEERDRQERLAEERRKAAEQAAREAAEAAARAPVQITPSEDAGQLGQGRPEVVQVALQFVGVVDYVYGGTTPSGFDCSGLTQYCYARIGVTIPRTSRSQFASGTHIPADRLDLLLPGDLVFFGYGGDPGKVHHVGIYVGNGEYLHAPQTGQKVTISSLTARIEKKDDYVGGSRF